MKFINPNIHFTGNGFWIRWTLIAFIIIIVSVIVIGFFKRLKVDFEKLKVSCKKFLLLLLVYLSTIPIYIFRDFLGDCGNSVIYKVAESLNNIESLVIVVLVGTFIYGCMYKNFHTFINFYIKVLATLELTYIIAYYITNQVALEWWFNWMGVFLLGIVFILLYIIEIKALPTSTSFTNPYNAINEYDNLYSLRKYQADNIISIIKSKISDSGYSICINGEWGSGKTSLINGVMDKVRDDTKVNVYEIRINAMELDNSTAMMKYLFAQMENGFDNTC